MNKFCPKCAQTKDASEFGQNSANPDGLRYQCKACESAARKARAARNAGTPATRRTPTSKMVRTEAGYIASRELLALWESIVVDEDEYPENLMFLGPSGCGKTEGARYLAEVASLEFTKVDAAAMTDPESWFGTREVVAVDGTSVTTYRPSDFVLAIQRPGVVLIDEVNRIRDEHRNILLPLTDGTYQVTNPLTGDVVKRHPRCFIIMSGNRGLQFTGTYAVDPALTTRALIVPFAYLPADDEVRLAMGRTGVAEQVATVLVRFANETRTRAEADPDMAPISTREVLKAAKRIAHGLDPDVAVQTAMIYGASDEGGAESVQTRLAQIWTGLRPFLTASDPA